MDQSSQTWNRAGIAPASSDTAALMERVLYEVKRVVVGQDHFLERILVAILAQGHLLIEGVPGLAKTLTVNTLAKTVSGSFKRIQFTPDLLPADLVGTRIYNQKISEFSTVLGPVFANLLLADEIGPDTCRLWDLAVADPEQRILDKDRFRQDLGGVVEAYGEVLKRVQGACPEPRIYR